MMFGEVSRSEGVDGDGDPITAHRTSWSIGSKDTDPTDNFSPERLYGVNTFVQRLNFRENLLALADDNLDDEPRRTNSQAFSSNHPGGVHFAYADGHVNTIDTEIGVQLLRQLSSINGGESVSDDGF